MNLNLYNQARDIWKNIFPLKELKIHSGARTIEQKSFIPLQTENSYHYIFNIRQMEIEYISPNAEQILGFPLDEMNAPFLISLIHPDDMPWFMAFEKKVVEFFNPLPYDLGQKYKTHYDVRLQKADGSYIRVLHQMQLMDADKTGMSTRVLCVHTDITSLKKGGHPELSFVGSDDAPSYFDVEVSWPVIN
ncbi:PAS domain-containing protein [Danxiaibacter flavus]|uniref:PAS domain-containing protein n=1 Tax=Danxiaibacter flavus TaxID=3049108 RepID=A0ABV3ZGH8_9BACT|nr:PAS domain-containing protein [Chitinophagaceae bacterium DXS]